MVTDRLDQPRRPAAAAIALTLCVWVVGCASTRAQAPPSGRHAVIDGIVAVTAKVILEREGKRVSSASGVVVASRAEGQRREPVTYVLTAQHVLDGKDGASIFVRFMGPQAAAGKVPAQLFRTGDADTLDLAVLRLPGIVGTPAVLAAGEARLGEEILIAGFPWGKRFGLFGGIVSQLPAQAASPEEGGGDTTLVVDAASANGVSGGGVFLEASGELLGVVEGYQTASIAVESRSRAYSVKVPVAGETFAVPAARIRAFLEAAGLGQVTSAAGR
jgi:hypothetical protein